MDTKPQPATKRAKLTAVIAAVNIARDISGTIPPARTAFASVSTLLTMIRVCSLLPRNNEHLVHLSLGPNA